MRRIEIDSDSHPNLSDLDGPLTNVVAWADALVQSVPPEYRDTAVLKCDYGEGYWISVRYERPETEADRIADAAEADAQKERRDARERAEYERLRAKFGT